MMSWRYKLAWHRDYNLSQTKTIAETTVKAYDESLCPRLAWLRPESGRSGF